MIRRMREADIGQVMFIENTSFIQPWTYQTFKTELNNPRTVLDVITHGGGIVAYSGYNVLPDAYDITKIAVITAYRGRGFGEALINNIISEARKNSVRKVILEVGGRNAPAQKLYEKYGFRRVGLRKKYYENGDDAILMEWNDKEL